MYERMLNKQEVPTFQEMLIYCGTMGEPWRKLDQTLTEDFNFESLIRFPYGKSYGWSKKYFIKKKHICDIFAEKEAFYILVRLADQEVQPILSGLSAYAKEVFDNRYPCGEGGWLNYRVTEEAQIPDLLRLLEIKKNSKK